MVAQGSDREFVTKVGEQFGSGIVCDELHADVQGQDLDHSEMSRKQRQFYDRRFTSRRVRDFCIPPWIASFKAADRLGPEGLSEGAFGLGYRGDVLIAQADVGFQRAAMLADQDQPMKRPIEKHPAAIRQTPCGVGAGGSLAAGTG